MSAGPRHSRKEIRVFAAWLRKQGWTYESTDAKGHTLWSHPRAAGLYKLAETPKHFNVQLARRDVLRMVGGKIEGKRRPKPSPSAVPRPSAPRAPRPAETLPKVSSQRPLLTAGQARAIESAEANRRFYEGLMRRSA
ncbi:hypothetical protein GUY44_07640 [Pimelobacter simplex]|uniref:Uncharacterized protein n=1 Tax=Nocardioides simplex TaxID=2045 RepID=A0A0A1DGZ9_NOCSI|nr:hypothetical protein [Pimelobacter simplex]AIY15808.1 hypothetical protein KR76_01745 [Pimelobacter simplex]MCG8150347.1 hypothetical protein [Pimelobacter simplex]GEB16714.1 hypothetical protein NSI01_50290 [Pimelobacter simplex]SFM89617.1 hypothetical protein SAMN05421671_4071 [Pimelobacter simplex]